MVRIKDSVSVGLKLVSLAAFHCFALSLSPSAALAQQPATPKTVLVLDWYSRDHPWNIKFDEAFQDALKSAPPGTVEYYYEYLETTRFPGENQSLLQRNYLRQKYADKPIDVVIANSDASLDFLTKGNDDLFPNTPMVFVATRPVSKEEQVAGPGLTGIINLNSHRQNLDLIQRLRPGTTEVFVISGTLEGDKKFEALARSQLRDYEDKVTITYLTDYTLAELCNRVSRAPASSAVFYIWQQLRDDQGRTIESLDIFDAVARCASVPTYGMNFLTLFSQSEGSTRGTGIVGGYVATASDCGARAAELALRILGGEKARDIPIENAPSVPTVDWRELRRWGISEDKLPPGSIVHFKVLSFWEQYRLQVLTVSSIFIVEAILI